MPCACLDFNYRDCGMNDLIGQKALKWRDANERLLDLETADCIADEGYRAGHAQGIIDANGWVSVNELPEVRDEYYYINVMYKDGKYGSLPVGADFRWFFSDEILWRYITPPIEDK